MPGRDGTGPLGGGPLTGRGLGLACRRGFGRGSGFGYRINPVSPTSQKELLKEQKKLLQERLEAIDKDLDSL
ncbi:MAG: DUF5320 domain-containing protein [Tissierellia bacterium]|jgi:hypothetical protein|nr:DUF5320 domain-containing protein [Tissierellia bacterium]